MDYFEHVRMSQQSKENERECKSDGFTFLGEGHTHSMWKHPDQGSNQSHSGDNTLLGHQGIPQVVIVIASSFCCSNWKFKRRILNENSKIWRKSVMNICEKSFPGRGTIWCKDLTVEALLLFKEQERK